MRIRATVVLEFDVPNDTDRDLDKLGLCVAADLQDANGVIASTRDAEDYELEIVEEDEE